MAWTPSALPSGVSMPSSRSAAPLIERCALRSLSRGRTTAGPHRPVPGGRLALHARPGSGLSAAGDWPELMALKSHELRTPLNAVIGFTELMRHELHGPLGDRRYAEYLDHIASSARDLLQSAENTLALASQLAVRK